MLQHYLMGKKFLLMTDHHKLTNYFKHPTLNTRQAQWVDFLSGFDFEIKHLKGKENRVRYSVKLQYRLSPSDRWIDIMGDLGAGRYVKNVCHAETFQMGVLLTFGPISLQQRLSYLLTNEPI